MNNPLVSIIIPTYNRASIITKTLDSVLAQTYRHWECLVVDDGSEDATMKLLTAYQSKDNRFRFFKRHREPKGAPTCRNIGLEHSKGDFIIYLDSDDYLLPFCLEQRVRAIEEFPDCDLLVFPMGEMREEGIIVKREIPTCEDYLIPFLSADLPWSIMCPIWKRSFLVSLGGFTEGYKRFNDPELMIRTFLEQKVAYKILAHLSYDCVLIPSPKEEATFYKKVERGLHQFIPDLAKLLNMKGRNQEMYNLVFYLRLWLKYYYAPQPKGKFWRTINLIVMFYRVHIISIGKLIELNLRLCHFQFNYVLGFGFKDKLTNTSYFLKKS